jgi:Transposase
MPVTQEGPDFLSRYCPVQASGFGETVNASSNQELPLWKPRKKLPVIGTLQRIGVEATGTYGAGLLRYMQQAGIEVLEVTTPDKHDRRKRGKNDDLDAQNAAHAAFAGKRTVTPKSRDGMIESLRVLKVPKDSCWRSAYSIADDPQHHRLRAGRTA